MRQNDFNKLKDTNKQNIRKYHSLNHSTFAAISKSVLYSKVSKLVGSSERLYALSAFIHLLVEMLVDYVEYLYVDEKHEQQGGQHPAEEVEIHHVVHADDVLKRTGHLGLRPTAHGAVGVLQLVPAKQGC